MSRILPIKQRKTEEINKQAYCNFFGNFYFLVKHYENLQQRFPQAKWFQFFCLCRGFIRNDASLHARLNSHYEL